MERHMAPSCLCSIRTRLHSLLCPQIRAASFHFTMLNFFFFLFISLFLFPRVLGLLRATWYVGQALWGSRRNYYFQSARWFYGVVILLFYYLFEISCSSNNQIKNIIGGLCTCVVYNLLSMQLRSAHLHWVLICFYSNCPTKYNKKYNADM